MKTIKSVLIGALVALLGSSARAEDKDFAVDVQLSVGGTTNALEVLNAALAAKEREAVDISNADDWLVWPTNNSPYATIVSMDWVDKENPMKGLTLKGHKTGTAEAVLRYKGPNADLDVEYTFNVCVSTVEIEKTVVPNPAIPGDENDHSNAMIRIVSHVDCGTSAYTNRILFVGSLCDKHRLKDDTINSVLTNLVKKAEVDWCFFDNGKTAWNQTTVKTANFGTYEMNPKGKLVGEKHHPTIPVDTTAHCNLKAYLALVTNKLDIASAAYRQYDYVVFEFDSYRLATNYEGEDDELTTAAARCLKKFYEKGLVFGLSIRVQRMT